MEKNSSLNCEHLPVRAGQTIMAHEKRFVERQKNPDVKSTRKTRTNAYFDQLSPAFAVRADAVDDLGQVDSSGQVIVWHEGPDSHQVFITTGRIHLFTR